MQLMNWLNTGSLLCLNINSSYSANSQYGYLSLLMVGFCLTIKHITYYFGFREPPYQLTDKRDSHMTDVESSYPCTAVCL